jgi:uncharacterized protein
MINIPFEANDLDEFARLLRANPQYLVQENGADLWLWRASVDGRLDAIKVLVRGLDVNTPHDSKDQDKPDNPFYQPEGAIEEAASKGHLEVVRWLLEHGARINYVVHGKPRCLPLLSAAMFGHLDVVKLLVKHGADINGTCNGLNAITQAEDLGHFDIRDYLHSLGARTFRETTPPNHASAHAAFLRFHAEERGPLSPWKLEMHGNPEVTVRVIPASEKSKVQTLLTVGLSDHRLAHGRREHACTELRCMLPPDWPLTESGLGDPVWNWPVEWLKRLVNQLRTAERWPEEPVVFMNGDPAKPLAPGTQLSGWLCLRSLEGCVQAPDYRWIDIHSLFPIYAEECELLRKLGQDELVKLFQRHKVPLHIQPQRQNIANAGM